MPRTEREVWPICAGCGKPYNNKHPDECEFVKNWKFHSDAERDDRARFAWCFLNSARIDFYNMGRQKGVDVIPAGPPDQERFERKIRSSKHALDAWRKAVDEAMRKEVT